MYFDDYNLHKDAKIRDSLFWEYEFGKINWKEMKVVIVQRVIERGRLEDFYAIINLYGIEGVKETIKQIPYLNPKDIVFVSSVFEIKKEDLKCYSKKQLKNLHWNS
jgi:hypothetical protein